MARRHKDEPIILPADVARDKANRAIAAANARRQAYLDRYAAATREALTQVQANPDYRTIVEYLAEQSATGLEHMVLDTLITDVTGRGCTLKPVRIRSFLERDLKLKTWIHQGDLLVRVPHGWTVERGSYPLDTKAIWELWIWFPPTGSEWA